MTVAAYFTEWMATWGVFGLAVVAVSAACLIFVAISIATFVVAAAKEKKNLATYIARCAERSSDVNPLDDIFRKKVINIVDMFLPHMQMLSSKNFKECHFMGPGVVLIWNQCSLSQCLFDGSCNFVVIDYRKNHTASGLVAFENTQFEKCVFVNVTFILAEGTAKILRAEIPSIPDNKFLGFEYENKK